MKHQFSKLEISKMRMTKVVSVGCDWIWRLIIEFFWEMHKYAMKTLSTQFYLYSVTFASAERTVIESQDVTSLIIEKLKIKIENYYSFKYVLMSDGDLRQFNTLSVNKGSVIGIELIECRHTPTRIENYFMTTRASQLCSLVAVTHTRLN